MLHRIALIAAAIAVLSSAQKIRLETQITWPSEFSWDATAKRLSLGSGVLEGDWMAGTGIETPIVAALKAGSLATPSSDPDPVLTVSKIDASLYADGVGIVNIYGNKRGGDEGMEILTIAARQTNSPSNLVGIYPRIVMDQGRQRTIAQCRDTTPIECDFTATHGAISNTGITISGNAAANGSWLLTVVDTDTVSLQTSTASGLVAGGTGTFFGTGWAVVPLCYKSTEFDKCSTVEVDIQNQSGVDAGYQYADPGLANGLAVISGGTAKATSAIEIISGDGATSLFRTGIRFAHASIVNDNYALRLPNRGRIGSLHADGTTETALLYMDGADATVLNYDTGEYLYFALNNSQVANFDNGGMLNLLHGATDVGVAFASLGAVGAGKWRYCTDCQVTGAGDNTCATGGSGAFAFGINGAWRCFALQN